MGETYRALEGAAHGDDRVRSVLDAVDRGEELLRHRLQRVLRPRGEPIDGAAVDERGELAQPRAEGVADGRHAQDHVQVGAALLDEEAPQPARAGVGDAELARARDERFLR